MINLNRSNSRSRRQLPHYRRRNFRATEKEALHHRTLDFLQKLLLDFRLNPFRDERDPQRPGHRRDGMKNRRGAAVPCAADVGDEGPINLERVNLQALKIRQR
jgi:hypothetical protein